MSSVSYLEKWVKYDEVDGIGHSTVNLSYQGAGFKNISTEVSVVLWELFLKDKCLFLKDWIKFIVDKKKP